MINKISGNFNIFLLDLRALALMRIAVGITLIIDLIIRLFNLEAHYTDNGIIPLEGLFRYLWNPFYFSLYNFSASWQLQLIVFLLNFICIGLLLFGYKTRLATFLCWLFILSIHNRNPLIHQGGDDLLRLILFWGLFFPWGHFYSIDASRKRNCLKSDARSYISLAVLGYILQVMYVYFFSAILKNSGEWNGDFTALYYALSFDQIVLPTGKWLYQFPAFLKTSTAMVYYIEMVVPFFLLVPFAIPFFRVTFICIILALHIGIALTLNVGIFPLVAVVAMVGLLPGNFIDELKKIKIIQHFKQSFDFIKIYAYEKKNKPKHKCF